MKTLNNLFNNSLAMVAIAAVSVTAALGLTSCQDDDDFNNNIVQQVDDNENEIEPEDSLAVTDRYFAYDKFGTSSPDQYVEGFDYTLDHFMPPRLGLGDAFDLIKDIATYTTQNYKDIIENPAKAVVNFTFSKIYGNKEPDIMGELKNMQSQINDVEKILKDADGKIEDSEYARIYEERVKNLIGLRSANCTHLASYYKYIANGDIENANKVIDSWSNKVINKNSVEYTMKEFLEMTPQCNNMGQKSVTEVYDYWVFQTTPWEHMGYDKRDALRHGDIITAYTGYILLKAFYTRDALIVHENDMKELDIAFENFCKFYKGRECVQRHDDRIVCQIKGANIVFKKNIKVRDMLNHPWIPNNSALISNCVQQFMYGDGVHNKSKKAKNTRIFSTDVLKSSLTKEEAKAIYDYYNSENSSKIPGIESVEKSADGKYSLESIMKSAGFNLNELEEGKQHVMTLNDDCHDESESFFNNNYALFFDNVVLANDAANPIRSNWKVGVMWIVSKSPSPLKCTRYIFKHWDNYESNNSQFFYTNIEKRYTDMKPFN